MSENRRTRERREHLESEVTLIHEALQESQHCDPGIKCGLEAITSWISSSPHNVRRLDFLAKVRQHIDLPFHASLGADLEQRLGGKVPAFSKMLELSPAETHKALKCFRYRNGLDPLELARPYETANVLRSFVFVWQCLPTLRTRKKDSDPDADSRSMRSLGPGQAMCRLCFRPSELYAATCQFEFAGHFGLSSSLTKPIAVDALSEDECEKHSLLGEKRITNKGHLSGVTAAKRKELADKEFAIADRCTALGFGFPRMQRTRRELAWYCTFPRARKLELLPKLERWRRTLSERLGLIDLIVGPVLRLSKIEPDEYSDALEVHLSSSGSVVIRALNGDSRTAAVASDAEPSLLAARWAEIRSTLIRMTTLRAYSVLEFVQLGMSIEVLCSTPGSPQLLIIVMEQPAIFEAVAVQA